MMAYYFKWWTKYNADYMLLLSSEQAKLIYWIHLNNFNKKYGMDRRFLDEFEVEYEIICTQLYFYGQNSVNNGLCGIYFAVLLNKQFEMKQLQFSAECDQYLWTGDQMINWTLIVSKNFMVFQWQATFTFLHSSDENNMIRKKLVIHEVFFIDLWKVETATCRQQWQIWNMWFRIWNHHNLFFWPIWFRILIICRNKQIILFW